MNTTFTYGAIDCQIDSLNYISFEPVLDDNCNKCNGMFCPVCGMVHINIAANQRLTSVVAAAGILSSSQNGPLPYI